LACGGRTVVREDYPHRYRGMSLAACIEGMARLAPEDTLLVNPSAARELGVKDGDSLTVDEGGAGKPYRVALDRKVPQSVLYLLGGVR
jgi:predicted molibdopterin-dependent oxidoreductase YjgC